MTVLNKEEDINFICPENLPSIDKTRNIFYHFAAVFNHFHYTKKDLVEHIANNGMDDSDSILNEVIFVTDNVECNSKRIPESLAKAIVAFGDFVIKDTEYGFNTFLLEYLWGKENDLRYSLPTVKLDISQA